MRTVLDSSVVAAAIGWPGGDGRRLLVLLANRRFWSCRTAGLSAEMGRNGGAPGAAGTEMTEPKLGKLAGLALPHVLPGRARPLAANGPPGSQRRRGSRCRARRGAQPELSAMTMICLRWASRGGSPIVPAAPVPARLLGQVGLHPSAQQLRQRLAARCRGGEAAAIEPGTVSSALLLRGRCIDGVDHAGQHQVHVLPEGRAREPLPDAGATGRNTPASRNSTGTRFTAAGLLLHL
jgi:hypothetical protein